MPRPLDHSATLIPGTKRGRIGPTPLPWARVFFIFLYVTATACAIVMLTLSWRDEIHRRHAAEATAATSGLALRSAEQRAATLSESNDKLSARAARLAATLTAVRERSSKRGGSLRNVRSAIQTTATFAAALDGLDEPLGDTLAAEDRLVRSKALLATHLESLDRYLRKTPEPALDRAVLQAKTRTIASDLSAMQALLVKLTTGQEQLQKAVEPLGQAGDVDKALKAVLAQVKAAL